MPGDHPALPSDPVPPRAVANFPKQAIVVIHGMGEQRPMDTIKNFVNAVWKTDAVITANGLPDPAEAWSKPDLRTGSLELRRITTRQSIPTKTFPAGIRSDFYELYWADLSGGSQWRHVQDWIKGLLLRNPFTRVPRSVLLAWLVLWIVALFVIVLLAASVLPDDAAIGSLLLWKHFPFSWLSGVPRWVRPLLAALLGVIAHKFVVPYFGRVVRYTQAKPDNIRARRRIRERGLKLLTALHQSEYERIIIVGHSLGAILAYDLISYFWASHPEAHSVKEGTPEFQALSTLIRASKELASAADEAQREACRAVYHEAQTTLCRSLRLRNKPANAADPDTRWLITDLVTLGSPLTHAEFLLAKSKGDLDARKAAREFPTSPPVPEQLDPDVLVQARKAALPLDDKDPSLFCFPSGNGYWQLHHAAQYAVVRWTNIYDPAQLIFCGDIISGAVAPAFGPGIADVNLAALRGQSWRFTHTRYWAGATGAGKPPPHIVELRAALDLAGQGRMV